MEQISAMMDGELGEHDARQGMLRLDDTAEAREAWAAYHVIGDVMRRQHAAIDVSARVAAALQNEPTVLAPRRNRRPAKAMTFALSAAASVSAIAVVGWMAFSTGGIINQPVELATNAPALQVAAEPKLVSAPDEGQMNEYLLAHQGVSPSSGLQGVAPYIRTIAATPANSR